MTAMELRRRRTRAASEPLVVLRSTEGYRVYSASTPGKQYEVTGTAEHPECDCPDFQRHRHDPNWRCKHILAAFNRSGDPPPYGNGAHDGPAEPDGDDGGKMLVRRSASPDGRIDSVTVEFECELSGLTQNEAVNRALGILEIQDEIMTRYLDSRPAPQSQPQASTFPPAPQVRPAMAQSPNGNGAIQAHLTAIGGMNGRWGRRLFIHMQSSKGPLRLFGTQKELAAALTAAGYGHLAGMIVEGATLNVPCLAVTKPSANGRYTDVDRLLPPNGAGAGRFQ